MEHTRQELQDLIKAHERIINDPSSDIMSVANSKAAVKVLKCDLRTSLSDNWGVCVNQIDDFETLKRQADEGDIEAQCALGDVYADHTLAERYNLTEAVHWYEKASEKGHSRAQWLLGAIYLNGIGGYEKNMEKAEFWLKKSAESGDPEGQYALGGLYFVKPDFVKAEYWLEQAAKQGSAEAVVALQAVKAML